MIELFSDEHSEDLTALYQELQTRYAELESKYNALLQDYETLKQSKSKAGRKPNDEKWTAKYHAFAEMKAAGCKREEIQEKLNMSRATYFRYNKLYTEGEPAVSAQTSADELTAVSKAVTEMQTVITTPAPAIDLSAVATPAPAIEKQPVALESAQMVDEVLAKANKALSEHTEELILDPETGEYVTPEGLRRRRKLAEIRARRAAQEEQNRLAAEAAESSEAE